MLKFFPLMRITPTPALPGAVATAMMGNFLVIIAVYLLQASYAALKLLSGLFSKYPINLPLLSNGQNIVGDPIQHQARREEKEHD